MQRKRFRFRLFNDRSTHSTNGYKTGVIALCLDRDPSLTDEPGIAEALLAYEIALHEMLLAMDAEMITIDDREEELMQAIFAAQANGEDFADPQAALRNVRLPMWRRLQAMRRLHQSTADAVLPLVKDPLLRSCLEDDIHIALHPYLKPERGVMPEIGASDVFGGSKASHHPVAGCVSPSSSG